MRLESGSQHSIVLLNTTLLNAGVSGAAALGFTMALLELPVDCWFDIALLDRIGKVQLSLRFRDWGFILHW